MNVLSNKIIVEFDLNTGKLIYSLIEADPPTLKLEFDINTLAKMTFADAAQFLGERIILLNPHVRPIFQDYYWGEDGSPPKKNPPDRETS